MTPEQEKALALARARKRRAEAGGKSPAMASGLAELSAMSRNPVAPPAGPYENSLPATAAQFGAGSQSGIASVLGFPVDALTGGINAIGDLTGIYGPIENPVGGSGTFNALFAPFNENIPAPQTQRERVSRRIGEEVGASAAMLPVAAVSPAFRAAPLKATGVEAASALGSGTGAATANEIAPDSMTAEIIGALTGGLTGGMAATRALDMGGTGPVIRGGIDEQKAVAADAYGMVRADQRVLPQDSVEDMALGVAGRMDAERLNPRLQPGSAAVLDAILQDSSGPMRIEDIENLRRMTQQSLPVTAAPADQRLAAVMRDEITSYLDNLDDPVADALVDGRNATRRAKAAESIDAASTKAARRAASTGSGGNEINAMRQNLRSILDNPRKSRSFTPAEREMMDAVVRGDMGQNAMRRLSRFAPTSGGLSALLNIGGGMALGPAALPVMAVTEGAKALGERSTRKAIDALMKSIAPDRVLKTGEQGMGPVIAALLAGRTMAGNE